MFYHEKAIDKNSFSDWTWSGHSGTIPPPPPPSCHPSSSESGVCSALGIELSQLWPLLRTRQKSQVQTKSMKTALKEL